VSARVYTHSVTNSKGNVSVTAKPLFNSEFALRFAGDRGRLGLAFGSTATVKVHVIVVASLRVGSRSGGIAAPQGSGASFFGSVTPGRRGKSVELQKLVNRQWETVAVTKTSANGNFSFVLTTSTKGLFGYKLYRPLDSTNLAGGSPELYLKVT
jgi:hypothetical protein